MASAPTHLTKRYTKITVKLVGSAIIVFDFCFLDMYDKFIVISNSPNTTVFPIEQICFLSLID